MQRSDRERSPVAERRGKDELRLGSDGWEGFPWRRRQESLAECGGGGRRRRRRKRILIRNIICQAHWLTLNVYQRQGSQNLAATSLLLLARRHLVPTKRTTIRRSAVRVACLGFASGPRFGVANDGIEKTFLLGDDGVDGCVEDVVDSCHFFTRALHVECAHLLRDTLALSLGDGCQSLALQEIDTCALVPEI